MTFAISTDFLSAFSNVGKAQQRQVREFVERFRERPDNPGTNYEPIQSARDKNLYSVRINQAYRAIVCHPPGTDVYILAWVDHHDDAYRWAERKRFSIHPTTGALQVISVDSQEPAGASTQRTSESAGLFAGVKDKYLLQLGVPPELLASVRQIETDLDLDLSRDQFPAEAFEALYMLACGYALEDVFREMEKPVEQPGATAVDPKDFVKALENEDSKRRFLVPEDVELAEALNAPLDQWRVFLHPKQRKLVTSSANGPVRVLGGAGTGKTVAAMHRAAYLVSKVFPLKTDRILFTTFTRNLAADIQENLRKICKVEDLSRIDVVSLDAWVSTFLRAQGYKHKIVFDGEENQVWELALGQAPADVALPPSFYRTEWEQVIQAQDISTAEAYMRAPRLGRGTKISRETRKRIWPVFQEYRAELNAQGKKEFIDLLRDARGLIEHKRIAASYRAVVVDESQDMSAEAWRLLRAIVPAGPNDMFMVGDAHQRIYGHRPSLGQCGINIRGRGKKLRVNYRTTEEIRRFAVQLLVGRPIDDLDGGKDDQKGYISLMHGSAPQVQHFESYAEEMRFLAEAVRKLEADGIAPESMCLVARTKRLVQAYADDLRAAGVAVYEVKRNTADQREKPGVRVATMHRVKGLEFDHLFVAAVNDGVLPLSAAIDDAEDEVGRRNSETAERSLLYVAITRARRSVNITSYGTPSAFLMGGSSR